MTHTGRRPTEDCRERTYAKEYGAGLQVERTDKSERSPGYYDGKHE